jgi:hypothetical protein
MRLNHFINRVHLGFAMMRVQQGGYTRCFARLSAALKEYRLPAVSREGVANAAD